MSTSECGSSTECTYSCRLIAEFLEAERVYYTFNSAPVGILHYAHGLRISLGQDDTVSMSIQTHPDIAATSFAETFLMRQTDDSSSVAQDDAELGYVYRDVRRFQTPELLFDHILQVVHKYGAANN